MNKRLIAGALIAIATVFIFAACNPNKPVIPEPAGQVSNNNQVTFTADSFAYYENILVNDSMNVELRMALASNYYAEQLFAKAIDHLLKVVRMENKNLEALITLGNVYYDAGQNDNAVVYYEKALQLDARNVNVRCDMATCYLNLKQPEKSLSLLKKNLEIDPKHAQSHHNLSVVYSQLGRTKEAEEEMKVFNSLGK